MKIEIFVNDCNRDQVIVNPQFIGLYSNAIYGMVDYHILITRPGGKIGAID